MKKRWLICVLTFCLPLVCQSQVVTFSKRFVMLEAGAPNTPSASDTVFLNFQSFSSNPKLVTSTPFEISFDGVNYNDTLVYSSVSGSTSLYIRSEFSGIDLSARGTVKILDNNFILNQEIHLLGSTINESQSISLATWNIKWFGLPSKCSCDTALVRVNVTNILRELDVDIWALQEIANEDMLQIVVNDLGPKYDYVISDYCSQIQTPNLIGYSSCQKLAYIYNKNKLNMVGQFGLLRSTYPLGQGGSSPYYYFASGRWPYVMTVVPQNSNDTLRVVNIHGKAFSGLSEHNRRAGGALNMTDSLNALFLNKKIAVLGDYNDRLEGATTQGLTISPYDYMLTNGFVGITRPSLFPGQKTYAGSFSNIIDNVVLSNTANNDYIANSTFILEEVDDAIANYSSTTTDHYPVLSHLRVNQSTNLFNNKKKTDFQLVQPNGSELYIVLGTTTDVTISVFSIEGKLLFSNTYFGANSIKETIPNLNSGMYIVILTTDDQVKSKKWIVL